MEPTFPAAEVERLRDERLNDLLQAKADPRRRADDGFVETIYAPGSPYGRPSAGTEETVPGLDAEATRGDPPPPPRPEPDDAHRRRRPRGGRRGRPSHRRGAVRRLGAQPGRRRARQPRPFAPRATSGIVRVIHRPGSVQTEIRVGHVGLPRLIPDFHAVSVMSAILGGLFNSRLNRKLREEKGYTYGAGAGFDMRRGAGPFAVRAAVNTEVTVPALQDMLAELDAMRDGPPTRDELHAARDYLVGVFPLRFETPPAVVGAIAGLLIHGLPMDELDRYRPAIEAVSDADVHAAARDHVQPSKAAVVLVGDADAILPELEGAAIGPITVEREALPTAGRRGRRSLTRRGPAPRQPTPTRGPRPRPDRFRAGCRVGSWRRFRPCGSPGLPPLPASPR